MSCELSVVLPCLNEEESIGICLEKIKKAFRENSINGEIVVCDNGSDDKSADMAQALGARVVFESQKGYGSALRKGIEESEGAYVIMADADDTYDFFDIPKFLDLLRKDYDLVIGNRFKGKILPGAMSFSHRYIGNPILSGMLRVFFSGSVGDSHCGLRGFSRSAYQKLGLQTTGMEFASEMVIHALKKKLKIAEIPITLHPRKGEAKIESFKDAWRHIRFMLLYSPDYLFLVPGLLILMPGLAILIRFLFGDIYFAGRHWGTHLMVLSGIAVILGWQILNAWFVAKVYSQGIGLDRGKLTSGFFKKITLEKTIVFGLLLFSTGVLIFICIVFQWFAAGFGDLSLQKPAILSLVLIAVSVQTIFTSFLASVLQIRYR